MTTTQEIIVQFSQNLGKLFFAIAAADKTVEPAEMDKLKALVHDKWIHLEEFKNTPYQNAAFKIISTFNWLNLDGEYDSDKCFKEFLSFKHKHESLFSKPIKNLIMQTADAIASSFANKNKSELIILAKLHLEFKKT